MDFDESIPSLCVEREYTLRNSHGSSKIMGELILYLHDSHSFTEQMILSLV